MNSRKRIEALERDYFPDRDKKTAYLYEVEFCYQVSRNYQGRERLLPRLFRREHERLVELINRGQAEYERQQAERADMRCQTGEKERAQCVRHDN